MKTSYSAYRRKSCHPQQQHVFIFHFMQMHAVHVNAAMGEGQNDTVIAHRHLHKARHLEDIFLIGVIEFCVFVQSQAPVFFAVVSHSEAVLFLCLLQHCILVIVGPGTADIGAIKTGMVVAEGDGNIHTAPFIAPLGPVGIVG